MGWREQARVLLSEDASYTDDLLWALYVEDQRCRAKNHLEREIQNLCSYWGIKRSWSV